MKLMLDNDINPRHAISQATKRAFDILCDELGIDLFQDKVFLSIMPEVPTIKGDGKTTGFTCMHESFQRLHMVLALDSGPTWFLRTLCHEMVHVKQVLKKEVFLTGDPHSPQLNWNGTLYSQSQTKKLMNYKTASEYRASPGEAEALDRQDELMARVLARLDTDDRKVFVKR